MEEDKKKKRNKKKKNKLSKIGDEVAAVGGEECALALGDQNGQDDQDHVSEAANVQDSDVFYLNTNGSNGGNSVSVKNIYVKRIDFSLCFSLGTLESGNNSNKHRYKALWFELVITLKCRVTGTIKVVVICSEMQMIFRLCLYQ